MAELINALIDSQNIPMLTALLLGILTSLSPCPLATNITAVAYIAKDMSGPKQTIVSGLIYTLGRGMSYTALAMLIYFGWSSFDISRLFQGYGDKILGPILIVLGLIMAGVIKIDRQAKSQTFEKIKLWLAKQGYLGTLILGLLFALAFCPYSGVLFFGALIPLTLQSANGLLLPPIFALGTGLPVILFSVLLAFSVQAVGSALGAVQKIEKWIRRIVAAVFILAGIYYLQFLIIFLMNLLLWAEK